jgi:hypothetical protein
MKKLVIIGALIAALATSAANAAGQKASMHRARAQALCPQGVILRPDRAYAFCGGRFWIRDPQTGQIGEKPTSRKLAAPLGRFARKWSFGSSWTTTSAARPT